MARVKLFGQLLLTSAIFLQIAPIRVLADCECGYSVNSTSDNAFTVFTDALESDFTTLTNITQDTDWVVQKWKIDRVGSRGPYGRSTELRNVVSNPSRSGKSSTGINGGKAGLELWVRNPAEGDEYVSVAEVDSARTDMKYGSFRTGLETTRINGTCAAFFWYLNDTQEIDMEFLSSQMNDTYAPVNLVLHSTLSFDKGGDASNTPTYKVIKLPFDPTDNFHEYRFDWKPGSVSFYADGKLLVEMREEMYVPKVAGKIILSHWSNGQPLWSGGPPEIDAKMVVSYVKAYFNSTDPARLRHHALRCPNPSAANAICQIPNQLGAPRFGDIHFFHKDPNNNMTNNQSIYAKSHHSAASSALRPSFATSLLTVFLGLWFACAV